MQSGPALAGAGPNARPRRGAHLSSGFITSSCLVNRAIRPWQSADIKPWRENWARLLMLQPLQWRCVKCAIHQERDAREEKHHIYVARTNNNRVAPIEWDSRWVASYIACESGEQSMLRVNGDDESDLVGWSLLLLAATVRSFSHMPLGLFRSQH